METLELYDDPLAFGEAASTFLATQALRCTVIASQLAVLLAAEVVTSRNFPTPYWFALARSGDGAVIGLAMRTADYPPYLIDMPPQAAGELAAQVMARGERPSGANGTPSAAAAFCERLVDAWGGRVETEIASRLFQLTQLRVPDQVPGSGRLATPVDLDLLAAWLDAFSDEVHIGGPHNELSPQDRHAENLRFVADKVAGANQWVWTDRQGQIVSMAGARDPAFGFARVGPVYTPPAARNQGYAAAVTALATRAVLERGAIPCLFTDLANPTSNGVYQRIGYEPVDDTVHLRIADTPA